MQYKHILVSPIVKNTSLILCLSSSSPISKYIGNYLQLLHLASSPVQSLAPYTPVFAFPLKLFKCSLPRHSPRTQLCLCPLFSLAYLWPVPTSQKLVLPWLLAIFWFSCLSNNISLVDLSLPLFFFYWASLRLHLYVGVPVQRHGFKNHLYPDGLLKLPAYLHTSLASLDVQMAN